MDKKNRFHKKRASEQTILNFMTTGLKK